MAGEGVRRRLAAILAADVAGYSRLIGADEARSGKSCSACLDEAKQTLTKLITVAPKAIDMHVRQRVPWTRVEDYEHTLEGLREAGWEG